MISIEEKRKLYLGDYERKKDIIDAKISDGIQKYRKGDCKIRFVNSDGSPVVGANLKITQSTHDFKFGANIFMLDEFDDEKKNLEEKLTKLKTSLEYFDEIINAKEPSRIILQMIIDKIYIHRDKTIRFKLKIDIDKLT